MRYAYATLITNDRYIDGVLNLHDRLQALKTKYPLLVMYTKNVNLDKISHLNLIKITHLQFLNNTSYFADTINKFQIFNFTDYDKIIFLDADLFPLENLDDNFNLTMYGNLLYSPRSLEDLHPHGGLFMVQPQEDEFKKILWYNAGHYVKDDEQILKELYYPYTELCFKGEIIHYGSEIKYWNSQKYNKKLLMSENIEQIKAFFVEFYQEYIERNLENVKL